MNTDSEQATALPPPISASFYSYPITVFKIKKIITSVKSTNSCGLDDILPKILKLLPDSTLGPLAHIFSLSFVRSNTSQLLNLPKLPLYLKKVIAKLSQIIDQLEF